MSSKILSVSNIDLSIEKINPPNLVINASGLVSTSGWTNGHLIPYAYITPPADGIYEFDFVADPPSGIVLQVISPIIAKPYVWENYPNDLTGVKIYASSNSITEQLSSDSKSVDKNSCSALQKVTPKELEKALKNNDPYMIEHVFVWEDSLEIRVRYGGGCKKHKFQLLWDGTERESFPVQIPLFLVHDNNDDPCKAIVSESLQFDLSNYLQHGVKIDLQGWPALIDY
jgi:hypothetical protein